MNIVSFLCLGAGFIYIVMAYHILKINYKAYTNRLFFIILILSSLWAFAMAFFHSEPNKDIAHIWYKVVTVCVFLIPGFMFHFVLVFTKRKNILKKKWVLFIIYAFSTVILISGLFWNSFVNDYVRHQIGWEIIPQSNSPWVVSFFIYYITCNLAACIFLISWSKMAKNTLDKKQAKLILFSIVLGFFMVIVFQIEAKYLKLLFIPDILPLLSLIWFVIIMYGIKKYNLMTFAPKVALDEIFFSIMDLVIILDQNGKIYEMNKRMFELSGFNYKQLKGKYIKYIFPVFPDLDKINNRMNISAEMPTSGIGRIPVILIISPIKNRFGTKLGFVIVGHDEREKKKLLDEIQEKIIVEKALRESQFQYLSTIDAFNDFIHVVNKELIIQLCNKTMKEFIKSYENDFYIGKSSLKEAFPFLGKKVIEEYNRVFQTGISLITEEETTVLGKVIYTETRKIPIIKNGEVDRILTIIRDVSEKKRMEQVYLQSEIINSISVLAGGIAHDYNNILTTIIGNINLAACNLQNRKMLSELLGEAENASLKARDLTHQLATFSRGGEPVKETDKIDKVLCNTVSLFLSGSNIKHEIILAPDLDNAEFDKKQLSRVFQNIILNAKQAMPDGGFLKINAQNILVKKGKGLDFLSPGKYLKIVIEDNGRGIKKENLIKIFNPYFSTKSVGSGLGLPVAYSIIKKHGGHIDVKSKVGKGSQFIIYLPATEKDIKHKIKKENISNIIMGKGRILLMDDDIFVRNTIDRLVQSLGYDIVCTESSEKAVSIYKKMMKTEKQFDLVLLDLTIPGGESGLETFKKLKKINPGVKAVICSGYSDNPVMSRYKEIGFCGMIKKPFKIEELSKVLYMNIDEKTHI